MQDSRGALYKIISTHLNLSSTARKTRIYYYYFLFFLKQYQTPERIREDLTDYSKENAG